MPQRRTAASTTSRPQHPHLPDNRHLLLDPRFLIQIATLILSLGWFAWSLRAEVQVLARDVGEIRQRLPNNEAMELRMKQIETEVSELSSKVEGFDGWVRITREQLAAKGFKP